MLKPSQVARSVLRLTKTPRLSNELTKKAAARGFNKSRSQNSVSSFILKECRLLDAHSNRNTKERIFGDFKQLRSDLTERARLHALDTGAEQVLTPKEMSRRAAARAGLQLPKLY